MEKKDAARSLYINEQIDQKGIAKILGVSENTIGRWKKEDGDWDNFSMLRDSSTQHIMELIHYQTSTLKKLKDAWQSDPEEYGKYPLINKGDIDALQKLHSTIRNDARKFNDYVVITTELVTFINDESPELAKEITEIADTFLNEKRKSL